MTQHGKRCLSARKLYDRAGLYPPEEAVKLLKQTAQAKFAETVEAHVRLGVDPKHADQQVRGTGALPAGAGRSVRVAAFAKGEKAKEAEAAGADYVGVEELVEKIQGGWTEFDVAVATPDVMNVLGPRGLMPNPKAGTVTFEVGKAVREIKTGKIEFRVDKTGIIHAPIGKAAFSEEDLTKNLAALIDALVRARPAAVKGQYVRTITIATTMGPGIKIDPAEAQALTHVA